MKQKLLFFLTALMLLVTGNAWGATVTEAYNFNSWVSAVGADQKPTFESSISSTFTGKDEATINCYEYSRSFTLNGNSLNCRFAFSNTSTSQGTARDVYFRYNNSQSNDYTGLFVLADKNTYFSILNLKNGDKVTIKFQHLSGGTLFYSSNATYDNGGTPTAIISGTTVPVSNKEYTMTSDGTLNLYLPAYSCINSITIVTSGNTTTFNDLKAYADALVDVENNNGAATTTLSNAIATQNSVVENATSQTQIDNATAALRTAMDEFVSVATPTKGHQFDLTYMLTNPNVEGIVDWGDAAAQGWFTDIPRTDLGTYNNFAARTNLNSGKNAIERFTSNVCTTVGTFALYQKVTLPSGNYLFKSFALANAATTIVMAAGNTEGDAVTASNFAEYSVNFTQASQSEVKLGTKISSTGTNTCNWTAITGIKLYKTSAPTFTLSNGQAKQLTFHNKRIGGDAWHNWMVDVVCNEERVAAVRADWWDDQAGGNTNFTMPYTHSYDGGFNYGSNVWEHFSDDMLDASVKLSVSYKDGSLYIIGTMEKANHIYYVNYIKAGLTGNVDVYLYGNNAKLSNISSIDASVKTTTVQPGVVKATIPSSGYGSLASAYGLDFSNVEGLTAFVVSAITNAAVKLTSINEIPGNSGVILKGTPGTEYSIPMKSDASFEGTNLLHAAVTAYACAANEVYILQSGQFHLVTAASTVPAGKAYLLAEDVPNEARSLIISDEVDPTGINVIEAAKAENDALKDGKYLIGGKVIIVKNGVKYSANGQILK